MPFQIGNGVIMSLILGLLTAALWGLTDFLVGVNSKKTGVLWSLLFSHLVAFVVLSSLVLTVWPFHFDPAYADTYLKAFISAVLISIGALLLCLAFKWGKISIIAPLVATYGCFTAFFSWAGGDVLSQAEYLGIGVCAIGVVFVSQSGREKAASSGASAFPILSALCAACLWGLSFWIQGTYVLPILEPAQMLLLNSVVGVVMVGAAVTAFSVRIPRLHTRNCVCLLGAGVANVTGFLCFAWGLASGSPAVVTVLSTLSGAVACIIAVVLLRERLARIQIIGCGLILLGAMFLTGA